MNQRPPIKYICIIFWIDFCISVSSAVTGRASLRSSGYDQVLASRIKSTLWFQTYLQNTFIIYLQRLLLFVNPFHSVYIYRSLSIVYVL